MYVVYQWCFGIGVIGPVIMLLVSGVFGFFGSGSDVSVDISPDISTDFSPDPPDCSMDGSDLDVSAGISNDGITGGHSGAAFLSTLLLFLPLSPLSLLCAALLFGTAGMLGFSLFFHLPLAIIFGILGCFSCNFVMRKLKNAKNINIESKNFIWEVGILTMEVGKQGYGEVLFKSIAGATTFTARHNGTLPQGSMVVATKLVDGEMWVEPLSEETQKLIAQKSINKKYK